MRIRDGLVFLFIVNVDVVESNQIEKVGLIDNTQAEQLADTWFGNAIFQLGQPAVRDTEPLVALGFRNSAARLLVLPNSYVAPVAKIF